MMAFSVVQRPESSCLVELSKDIGEPSFPSQGHLAAL